MSSFKPLFKNNTYNDKIHSITHLRFISFQIWKTLIFLLTLLLLYFLRHIYFLSKYLTLPFSLSAILKLYLITIGLDYITMFLFQHNQTQNSFFERLVKLFLSPSQATFAFFFFIILSLINLITIKRLLIPPTVTQPKDEDDINDFALYLSYSLLFSFKTINDYSFYKWPRLPLTRIDLLKKAIKRAVGKSLGFTLLNIVMAVFYYTMKTGSVFIGRMVIEYFIVVFIAEIMQYVSNEMLKGFICAKINPDSNQLKNEIDVVNYPINFRCENSFTSVHYLMILNEILRRGYYQPRTQLNGMLLSGNVGKEIKMKIDAIYNRLNEKMKMVKNYSPSHKGRHSHSYENSSDVNRSGMMTWFDFSRNEVFEQETSPLMIDLISEVAYNHVMVISTKMNRHPSGNSNGNSQYSPEQLYLLYLIEKLISFERIVKEMIMMAEMDKGTTVNKSIVKQLKVINERTTIRIKEIIHKNLKERFLVNYSENINEIIKQFRI